MSRHPPNSAANRVLETRAVVWCAMAEQEARSAHGEPLRKEFLATLTTRPSVRRASDAEVRLTIRVRLCRQLPDLREARHQGGCGSRGAIRKDEVGSHVASCATS